MSGDLTLNRDQIKNLNWFGLEYEAGLGCDPKTKLNLNFKPIYTVISHYFDIGNLARKQGGGGYGRVIVVYVVAGSASGDDAQAEHKSTWRGDGER